jgi:hypothetical protein
MKIRKRIATLSVVMLASAIGVVLAVSSTAVAGAGATHPGLNDAASARIDSRQEPSCSFENDTGGAVKSIVIDEQNGSDTVYWMQYIANGVESQTVTFKLIGPKGSNQVSQVQEFKVAVPTTNVTTPFGIAPWGDAAVGKWTLKVSTNTEPKAAECTVKAVLP